MEGDVKVYRVMGFALFSPDKLRKWQRFVVEVRAVKKEDAIEKVLSDLGSRHKLKRAHIKIISVTEISPEKVKSKFVRDLEKLRGWFVE